MMLYLRLYEGIESLRAIDLDMGDVGQRVGQVEVLRRWGRRRFRHDEQGTSHLENEANSRLIVQLVLKGTGRRRWEDASAALSR